MADVKWIKIVTDIFDDEKILLIESLPEADSLIVIWFKLLCLAGKQNNGGVFMINDRIHYTDEMFATIFRRPVNTVRLALDAFEQYGMIERINDTVTIPNWGKHQQLDALEIGREKTRRRVEKYRNKQRLMLQAQVCQYCGAPATGYDHVLALARGGTDTDDNKVFCCRECNQIKNDKPVVDFLNGNRERINDDIVTSNPTLAKFVTLQDVTGRYTVTQCNADRIDKNRIDKNIEREGEKQNEKRAKGATFTPPSLQEVEEYAREKGYSPREFDPESFVNFYGSKGWKVGKNKMENWHKAVSGWVSRYRKEHPQESTEKQPVKYQPTVEEIMQRAMSVPIGVEPW